MMKTQTSRGGSDALRSRADLAVVEHELTRLPAVLHARLTADGSGRIDAVHVFARRGSALLRVARDVRSVMAVAAGLELPLDRIVVFEQGCLDPSRAEPAEESTGAHAETIIDLRDDAPLDAAARRLLERVLDGRDPAAATEPPAAVPAWGELLVLSPPAEGEAPRAPGSVPDHPRTNEELPGEAFHGHGQAPHGEDRGRRWVGPDIFVTPASSGGLIGRSLRLFGVNR